MVDETGGAGAELMTDVPPLLESAVVGGVLVAHCTTIARIAIGIATTAAIPPIFGQLGPVGPPPLPPPKGVGSAVNVLFSPWVFREVGSVSVEVPCCHDDRLASIFFLSCGVRSTGFGLVDLLVGAA
ncbi:hypothetical protein AB0M34_36030 [Nocardia sp. NPDC050193]